MKEKKIKLHNLIFIYIITTIIVTVFSFSKYVTTVSRDNKAQLAAMATNMSVNIALTQEAYPGFSMVFPVEISNTENGRVCDVSQEFILKIDSAEMENLPLEFSLYNDEFCTSEIEEIEKDTFMSENFKFAAGVEETKTYFLKVYWPENEKNESLAFEIGYFSVEILATQVD